MKDHPVIDAFYRITAHEIMHQDNNGTLPDLYNKDDNKNLLYYTFVGFPGNELKYIVKSGSYHQWDDIHN